MIGPRSEVSQGTAVPVSDTSTSVPATAMQQRARRLARRGAAIFVTSLLLKSVSVLASILIARWLGPFLLGEWTLVTYVTGLVYLFIELGTGTAAVRLIAAYKTTNPARAQGIARAYIVLEIVLASAVLAVFVVLTPWVSEVVYRDSNLLVLFWIATVTLLISTVAACFSAILQAYERIRLLAKLSLVFGIVHSCLLASFVFVWGLVGGFVASLLANGFQLAVYLRVLRLGSREALRVDVSSFREILVFALPTFAATVFLSILNWLGATLLTGLHGFDSLGTYTVAQRIAFLVMYVPTAVVVPFFPMVTDLFQKDPEAFRRTFNHTLRYILLLVFPLLMAFATLARPLISLLYTSAYIDAAGILPITAAAALLSAFLSPATVAYYATGAMRMQFLLSLASFSVGVVAVFLLVPGLGAQGFAWALLGYFVSSAALGPVLLHRTFPDSGYGRKTVASLGLSAIVLTSGVGLYYMDVLSASAIGIVLVITAVVVTYLRVMTSRDRAFVASLIRGLRLPWTGRGRD